MTGMRGAFHETTARLLDEDSRLVVLLGDIGVWAFRDEMAKAPKKVINFGILEQSMISFAAGLSASGYFPVCHSIAPFIVERALEQIKVDFGYQSLPGNLVSVGASFDYSSLGGTHHAPGDIDALLSVPGLQILIPGHGKEFSALAEVNYFNDRLTYFRLSEFENSQAFLGAGEKFEVLQTGSLGSVIAIGPVASLALQALGREDLSVLYINDLSNLADSEIQLYCAGKTTVVCEPFYQGSTSQIVFEGSHLSGLEVRFEGIPRAFIHSYGTMWDQLEKVGLSPDSLNARIMRHF